MRGSRTTCSNPPGSATARETSGGGRGAGLTAAHPRTGGPRPRVPYQGPSSAVYCGEQEELIPPVIEQGPEEAITLPCLIRYARRLYDVPLAKLGISPDMPKF